MHRFKKIESLVYMVNFLYIKKGMMSAFALVVAYGG